MSQKVRESNFELLRIVAILFITMHHLLINGIDLCGYNCNFVLNLNSSIAVILNSWGDCLKTHSSQNVS